MDEEREKWSTFHLSLVSKQLHHNKGLKSASPEHPSSTKETAEQADPEAVDYKSNRSFQERFQGVVNKEEYFLA